MKTAVPGLVTLLNSSQTIVYADLYTITLLGGTVIRYTDHDQPVPFGGNTFGIGPTLKRSRTKTNIGVSVDSMELSLSAPPTVTVAGVPIIAFIAAGGFDGSRFRVERVFASSWTAVPAGTLLMFSGRMGDVTMGRNEANITIKSDLELLDVQVPKNLWTPGCSNSLYDSACGVLKATFTVANAVTASPTPTRYVFNSTLAQAAGYFDLGVVTFTSGANAGQVRTIKGHASGGLVTLISPLPFAPAAGDTFNIYPGCDKTQATCTNKFSNVIRFRGKPYVPVPETVS